MDAHEKKDCPAPAFSFTWLVLRQLDQHRKAFRDGRTIKIKELAFNEENGEPTNRQRAAEALAVPMMNLYSALGEAELASGMTMERAKEIIVNVLMDGEKTVLDLSEAFDRCYRFAPEEGRPASHRFPA